MTMKTAITRLTMAVLTTACAAAFAAPPLTTIQDELFKADGSPFEGLVMVTWQTFEASDTSNIPTNTLAAQVVGGTLYLKLVPTTTSQTAAYYSVRYVADAAVQFTELWSVPPSTEPLRVRDVRILWPPAAGGVAAPAEDIEIGDVIGLPEALDVRTVKGINYLPSRAAVISATGELEAASGSLTDCLRVDGTSGACGTGGTAIGFVDSETPIGTIDSVNTTYSLSEAPSPAESLRLYRNGILLTMGVDYSLNGDTVTFFVSSIPFSGDDLRASFRTDSP